MPENIAMESSVSPLPLPLWPLLSLSLILFAATIVSVTVSGHYTKQLYARPNQNSIETAAPTQATLATLREARLRRMF